MATRAHFPDAPAWPTNVGAPQVAGIGHNQPPLEERIPLEFREALLSGERADFLKKLDDLLGQGDPNAEDYKAGAVDRAKCTNENELVACGKLINILRAAEKHVSETHTTVKAPHLLACRLVDAEKNSLTGRITVGRQRVQQMQDDYAAEQLRLRKLEEQRLEEERQKEIEDRRKLEELAKANNIDVPLPPPPPPPPPPPRAPIRGDGATVSIGTEWDCVVEDYAKAFKKVKDDAKVREAIDAAIKRIVKATKGSQPIPGVRAFERAKTSSR